jgi:hypothetical protein
MAGKALAVVASTRSSAMVSVLGTGKPALIPAKRLAYQLISDDFGHNEE